MPASAVYDSGQVEKKIAKNHFFWSLVYKLSKGAVCKRGRVEEYNSMKKSPLTRSSCERCYNTTTRNEYHMRRLNSFRVGGGVSWHMAGWGELAYGRMG